MRLWNRVPPGTSALSLHEARIELWDLKETGYIDDLRVILCLIEDCPDMAAVKIRSVVEHVFQAVSQAAQPSFAGR